MEIVGFPSQNGDLNHRTLVMGKLTISTAMFHSYCTNYQKVPSGKHLQFAVCGEKSMTQPICSDFSHKKHDFPRLSYSHHPNINSNYVEIPYETMVSKDSFMLGGRDYDREAIEEFKPVHPKWSLSRECPHS